MNRAKLNSGFNWSVFVLGVLACSLGILVLIGWIIHQPYLIQLHPQYVPMQVNEALGFILGGIALMALFFLRSITGWIGVILFLLGSLTLLEYVFAVNLQIDELFLKHTITVETSHAGRMGPNAAISFILSGTALFLSSRNIYRKGLAYTVSILSLLVILIAALALMGYASGISLSYGWGSFTSMALHSAVGFLFLGVGTFLFAANALAKKLSWVVLFIGPLVTLVISFGFLVAESRKIELAIDLEKENLISRFSGYFVQKGQALERLKSHLEGKGDYSEEAWEKDVEIYFRHFPALETIAWIDEKGQIRFMRTNTDIDHEPDFQAPDVSVVDQKELPYFKIVNKGEGRAHLEMILPFSGNKIKGNFVAFIHAEKLIEIATYQYFIDKFHLIVSSQGNKIYSSSQNFDTRDLVSYDRWKIADSLQVNDIKLLFIVWPKNRWLSILEGIGPILILSLLICLTVVTAILTHFISSKLRLERQQALLLQSSGEGIFGLDREGNTTFVNQAAVQMLGWKEEELAEKLQHRIIHHTKRDGSPYPLEECPIYATLVSGKMTRSDNELFWKKDGTWFDIALISRPIVVKNKIKGAVVTFNDITDRKKLERELVNRSEELAASNKELELFSYSVSHDLRAPLRQIIDFIDFFKKSEDKKYLGFIHDAAQQMQQFISNLLSYSRLSRSHIEKNPVSLESLIEDIKTQLITREVKKRDIYWEIGSMPTVVTDYTLIYTVLLNLISNAIKFTQNADRAKISISAEETETEWIVSIKDNGVGFDAKYKDKLFQMFQRLHSESEFTGSGIGLANAALAIKRLGGRIWAEGKTGGGAQFYFSLPKSTNVPQQS